jgi:hypothetical protein
VIRLDTRISQLEQRLSLLEISFRNMEQQVRLSNVPSRSANDQEIAFLRGEIQALRQRDAEIACGLLRVDERTLTPVAREARRKGAADGSEPCRLNMSAPLQVSVSP